MNGILCVLKPPGMTSFDVVAWLRGVFGIRKIGHAGTLDPQATGLLPVCIGKATKTIDWFQEFDKSYRAEMILGITTNTQDGEGQILEEKPVCIDEAALRSALNSFIGDYEQIPPMYSAVKVGGKRLYELARKGIEIERKGRWVNITSMDMLWAKLDQKHPVVRFDVSCSKGTYIRTLTADIGEKIGCGAHMSFLVRTRVGPFHLEDAFTPEEIQKHCNDGRLSALLKPMDIVFQEYQKKVIDGNDHIRFVNGAAVQIDENGLNKGKEIVRVYSEAGTFLGLGWLQRMDKKVLLKPHKIF